MSLACLVCLRRRLYLLPLITTLWIIMSLFISYGIAVSYGHTEPDFPYISHTAIEAPERCVFGQLVNIGAVMLGMNVLVRYLFLKEIFKHKKMHNVQKWQNGNIAGVVIGVLSALGMSMVANFQDTLRVVYLTSTISEWLVAASILAFTLSFTWDFRSIVLESPKVKLNFQQIENGNNNNRTSTEMEATPRGTTPV